MFDKQGFTEYINDLEGFVGDEIAERIQDVEDFDTFLAQKGVSDAKNITRADVSAYIANIRDQKQNLYQTLLILAAYGDFLQNEDLSSEAFLLFDAADVMNRMSELTKEHYGQAVWHTIFGGVKMPEIGWTLDEMSDFARALDKRFKAVVSDGQYEQVCIKNAHAWKPEWNGNDRETFLELKSVDRFIKAYNDDFMDTLKVYHENGALFYAQFIDDDVIEYIKNNPICRRAGNKLYFTKIPFNVRKYLRETDLTMKRYHACHCPWAKRSVLQKEGPVSCSFCHCSLGHAKKNFDIAFERELTGRIIETVMEEQGMQCVFEVDIPDDIMERYVTENNECEQEAKKAFL